MRLPVRPVGLLIIQPIRLQPHTGQPQTVMKSSDCKHSARNNWRLELSAERISDQIQQTLIKIKTYTVKTPCLKPPKEMKIGKNKKQTKLENREFEKWGGGGGGGLWSLTGWKKSDRDYFCFQFISESSRNSRFDDKTGLSTIRSMSSMGRFSLRAERTEDCIASDIKVILFACMVENFFKKIAAVTSS